MFPQGGPGIALLLLRISVAGMSLYSVFTYARSTNHQWAIPYVAAAALLLAFGLLTPLFSIFACVLSFLLCVLLPGLNGYVLLSFALNAVALALLGPGAYSLDARLFGRRLVVLQDSKEPNSND
jgi:hypothetical protein